MSRLCSAIAGAIRESSFHGRLIEDVLTRGGKRTCTVRCLECGTIFDDPYQGLHRLSHSATVIGESTVEFFPTGGRGRTGDGAKSCPFNTFSFGREGYTVSSNGTMIAL
jgi:hypothetical protein